MLFQTVRVLPYFCVSIFMEIITCTYTCISAYKCQQLFKHFYLNWKRMPVLFLFCNPLFAVPGWVKVNSIKKCCQIMIQSYNLWKSYKIIKKNFFGMT